MLMYYLILLVGVFIPKIFADDNGTCSFKSPVEYLDPFPDRIFLTYGENRKFALKDYFDGVNITFDAISSSNQSNVTIQSKFEASGPPFSYDSLLANNSLGEVVSIFWDDTNLMSIQQNWTDLSLVLALTCNQTQNSSYSVIAGSIPNFEKSIAEQQKYYNIIPLVSPNTSQQMVCYKIVNVGIFEYYVDCAIFDSTLNVQTNFFYYIKFNAMPPSYYTAQIVNSVTRSMRSSPLPRDMKSTNINGSSILIRYTINLEMFNTDLTGIEVWNATEPKFPNLTLFYNGTDPAYPYVITLFSVEITDTYLYAIKSDQQIIIVSDWYSQPVDVNSYNFPGMTFWGSSLRKVDTPGGEVESLVVIGSVSSFSKYAALLFVSQIYKGYYPIPLPPKGQNLEFKVFSVSLSEDFFVVSYSIAQGFMGVSCYYLAVFNVNPRETNYCHSLLTYGSDNMIVFARMNPFKSTNNLVLIGLDNTYQSASVYHSMLEMNSVTDSENITLILNDVKDSPTKSFELIVIPPENMYDIYLQDTISSQTDQVVTDTGSQIYYPFDAAVYGPELQFNFDYRDGASQVYSNIQIQADAVSVQGTFFAFRRNNVSSESGLVLVQVDSDTFELYYLNIQANSQFSISKIGFDCHAATSINNPVGYFSVGSYDVFLIQPPSNMQYLLFSDNSQGFYNPNNTVTFNLTDTIGASCKDIKLLMMDDTKLRISCINATAVYIVVLVLEPTITVSYTGIINQAAMNNDANFVPKSTQVHPAYPFTVFVQTNQNTLYVLNYGEPNGASNLNSILTDFVVISGQFNAQLSNEVIIQPFANDLFFIVPVLNLIQHWDISNIDSPYLRRNLSLYDYNIGILQNLSTSKGIAYSTNTDIIYLLAENQETGEGTILILSPNDANSYLLSTLKISSSLNSNQSIYIDVSTTQQGALGNTLGDILLVSINNNLQFWEIYSTPYVVFQPVSTSGNLVNNIAQANCLVINSWSNLTLNLTFEVFQDEKDLFYLNQSSTLAPIDNLSLNFNLDKDSFFQGTIYNISYYNPIHQGTVNLSQFITQTSSLKFPIPNVVSVWELELNTYYLASDRLVIVDNDSGANKSLIIDSTTNCLNVYIDPTETNGIIICGFEPSLGFISFQVRAQNDSQVCSTQLITTYQDLIIDSLNHRLFLLTQGSGEETDAVIVYQLDGLGCLLTANYSIAAWSFTATEPDLQKFDVFIQQNVFIFFVLDANFGLWIISSIDYMGTYTLAASSYEDLYSAFGNIPESFEALDLTITDSNCENPLDPGELCNIELLIVLSNFHSILIEYNIVDVSKSATLTNQTVFLVPEEYEIASYQTTDQLLILLGANLTMTNQSLDMLIYNSTTGAMYYSNKLQSQDVSQYKTTIWSQPLIQDIESYRNHLAQYGAELKYPIIFISENSSVPGMHNLCFPDLEQQNLDSYIVKDTFTLSWDKDFANSNDDIVLRVANNYQELLFNITFNHIKPENPGSNNVGIIVGAVLFVAVVVGIIAYCRRKKRNQVVFPKGQKDPLRSLLIKHRSSQNIN